MRLRVTPVPIPNTMVKTQAADGTSLETVRESRWPPGYKKLKNTKQIRCKCSGDSYRYRQKMSNNLSVPTLSARKCCYDSWFYQWLESWSWEWDFSFLMTDKDSVKIEQMWKLERVTHHHVPWKLHIRNRNDKIFKYLNQDIRGNCYKQSNNYCLKKTDLNKIDLKPTPITLYRCSDHPFPWMRTSWSC